jgi:hypothetical protein
MPLRSQRHGAVRLRADGDLRDLPLIDRKRGLAKLIGKAKRSVTCDGQTAFPKNWSLHNMPGALSVRERETPS